MSDKETLELLPPTVVVEDRDDATIINPTTLQDDEAGVDSKITDPGVANRQSIYDKFNKTRGTLEDVISQPVEDEVEELEVSGGAEEDQPQKPEMQKVKIYGEERLVDKAIVEAAGGVKEYQKQVAAAEKAQIERDKKFIEQENNRLAQEKRELERLRQAPPVKAEPVSKTSDLPSDDHAAKRDKIKEAVQAAGESLLDGDIGEFSEKLAEYLAGKPDLGKGSAPVDVDAIVREVEQRTVRNMMVKQQQSQIDEAVNVFNVEFPELAADPELFAKADRRTVILQQEHPDKSPVDIVRMAGEEVRKVYAPKVPTTTTTPRDRLAEKRTMSQPRSGSVRATPPPAPKQPSRSDYVAQLKAQRGQA